MSKNLIIINKDENNIYCKSLPGSDFNSIFEDALIMINNSDNLSVHYEFNLVPLSINKDSTIQSIREEYNKKADEKYQEYVNSVQNPNEFKKNRTLNLIISFDEALKSKSSLIKWLGEFSDAYDTYPVECNKIEFAEKMKLHGYDLKIPTSNELNELDEKSRLEIGILANSYLALSKNEPIHYVAYNFSLQYAELENKELISSKKNKYKL